MVKDNFLSEIPNTTGIYKIKDINNAIIYIGKALRIKDRIKSHLANSNSQMRPLINKVEWIEVPSEVEALLLESALIQRYQPKFNICLRDNKSFLYIIITNEEFPRILSCRKNEQLPVKYKFGPVPSSRTVKDVLKMIRKIFPYCTQSPRSKKICFYSHINLCFPCPAYVRKQTEVDYKKLKKLYLKNIGHISQLLSGEINTIKNSLNEQVESLSKEQKFEEAQQLHKQLLQLEYITKPYYKISHFLEDPNFLDKEVEKRLSALINILKPYYKNLNKVERIEGIDISNILGEFASGSLVVFINGYKNSSLYKRFKIQSKGPNDVAMIKEVLERRLKHKEWDLPDLIVIDGGIPQVSSAMEVVKKYKNISIIGLAKKLERIIIPFNSDYISLDLSKNNDALRLIQEIRDESHRFAQNYYHKLKQKVFM